MRNGSKSVLTSLALLLTLILSFQTESWAWGREAHIDINKVAAEHIPPSMPEFLRKATDRIAHLGPEPDRWREEGGYSLQNAESPNHFIDLERIEGLGRLPRGRYQFYRLLSAKRAATKNHPDDLLPERVGTLPYAAIERYDQLLVAFREYRRLQSTGRPTDIVAPEIVFFAGTLGHYVGDGSQPLHTTVQYNGWTGPNPRDYRTQAGIHSEFETGYVSRNMMPQDFEPLVHAPVRLDHPFENFMTYLRHSHSLVERVYQLGKERAFGGPGTNEAQEFVEKRLAAGSQMLLDLWYTAWVDSAN